MTWLSPTKAAQTKRWPIGRDGIRVRCENYQLAVSRGRRPSPDDIECIRVGTHYRISADALDAWVTRKTKHAA